MRAVLLEVAPLPRESIRSWRRQSPEVGTPHDEGRQLFRVVERARGGIHGQSPHLVDLGLDRPLYREPAFVSVRFWIQIDRRITAIGTTREKHNVQMRIP